MWDWVHNDGRREPVEGRQAIITRSLLLGNIDHFKNFLKFRVSAVVSLKKSRRPGMAACQAGGDF
jgi:hypothetical protein